MLIKIKIDFPPQGGSQSEKFVTSHNTIYPIVYKIIKKAQAKGWFGLSVERDRLVKASADLFLFIFYLQAAWYQRTQEIQNSPCGTPSVSDSAFYKSWGFNCMLDYFRCRYSLDLSDVVSAYGFFEEDGDSDGIDFMVLESPDDCENLFIVQ